MDNAGYRIIQVMLLVQIMWAQVTQIIHVIIIMHMKLDRYINQSCRSQYSGHSDIFAVYV